MSQASFLDSVVTWDDRQCQQNLQEALPKLAEHLQQASIIQEELGILRIICLSFLPWVDIDEAESQVFALVSEKTCDILERLSLDIGMLPKQLSCQQEIHALIELWSELLECFTSCLKFAIDKERVDVPQIHSLPHGAVQLLKGTYSHCKDSSNIYGDFLANVTEPLSTLFKKAHALQQSLLGAVECLVVTGSTSQQDVQDLTNLCFGLFEVCQVVSSLDVKLVVGLWKAISRLSGKTKHLVQDHLDVDAMLIYLASEIKHGFDYLMQIAPPKVENSELSLSQGDSAAFQKSLKIHSYQLRVLISLLDSFVDTVSSCIAPIYNVMVNILMHLPPTLLDLSISSSGVSDLQQQLVNGFEPLMCLLVRNRTFGQYMLRKTEDCRPEENLAVLQIHVKILDCLPKQEEDIYDSWMKVQDSVSSTEYSILQRVFRHLEECHIELCSSLTVPGPRLMSVYEFAVTHVCGFVGSLPAKYFNTLEECLLENLLSAYPVVSRVAEDVWCFMSRFGSADLCYHHTVLLLDLTSSLQDTLIPAVVRLVQRLVKFLAPNHKTKLLQRYPVDKYRTLWGEVLLPVLGGELSAHQYQGMVLACAQPVEMFVAATSNTYADLIQLLSDLKCLTKLVSVNHKNDVPSIAMETVSNLWLSWAADWSGETIFTQCLVEMTELAGLMIGHIKNLVVLQILESLHAARGQGGVCIEVAACRFLQRCKKKAFPPDVQQHQVFCRLSSLFHSLLTSQDRLVQFTALVAFTQFAESTPHEDLVPECLADNQQLQDLVVAFLNKNLPLPEDYKETVFLRDQLVRLRKPLADQTSTGQGTAPQGNISDVAMAKEEKPCHRDMLDDISESNQRATKRKRPDDAAMPQAELTTLEQLISDLDAATRKLESMELSDENIVNKTSRRTKLLEIHSRLQRCLNKMA